MSIDKYLFSLHDKVREYYVLTTTFAPDVSLPTLMKEATTDDFMLEIYAVLVKYREALVNCADEYSIRHTYEPIINNLIISYKDDIQGIREEVDLDYIQHLRRMQSRANK